MQHMMDGFGRFLAGLVVAGVLAGVLVTIVAQKACATYRVRVERVR